ncbi:MAG: acyl carrier protein [Terriglobia bacterium]
MTKLAFMAMLEDVLSVAPGTLKDADNRESIDGWSSLTDVQILALISSELGIEADQDLLSFENVGQLIDLLERRNAFPDSQLTAPIRSESLHFRRHASNAD